MGKPIFITDPVVAAHYHVHPAEFVWVADDAEAAWLIAQHHGFGLEYATALPAAYFVHPDAPLPFVPFTTGAPAPAPAPSPAPAPAPVPPPPPPPAPAPQGTTLGIGPEDQHIKIDLDGDGTTDVHVIVDNPPKNTP